MSLKSISRMGPVQWVMLLALSILWGGSFFFNEIALRGLPPLLVVWGRLTTGALCLSALLAFARSDVRPYLRRWPQFMIMGALNTALPFSLIAWGQQHIDSGLASVINATTPAFTILFANFLTTDERASWNKITGAALGLGGVALLIGSDALTGFGNHVLGETAVMGAAMSYAMSAIYARRMADMPPLILACGQLSTAALLFAPLALAVGRPWAIAMPGVEVILAVAGLGALCSAVGYLLFFRILGDAGATSVQLVTLFIPFSATALGVSFLGEPLSWRLGAGMAIVTAAALLINGRFAKRNKRN